MGYPAHTSQHSTLPSAGGRLPRGRPTSEALDTAAHGGVGPTVHQKVVERVVDAPGDACDDVVHRRLGAQHARGRQAGVEAAAKAGQPVAHAVGWHLGGQKGVGIAAC